MRPARPFRSLILDLCLLVLLAFTLVGCGGGDEPTISTPSSIVTSATAVSAPVSAPEVALRWVEVQAPDVVGMYLLDAWDELQAVYMNSYSTWTDPSPQSVMHFHVIGQNPPAGTWVPMFSSVELRVVYPGYSVPDVMGMSEAEATQLIDYANLTQVHFYVETPDSADWEIVIAQEPAPGTLWGNHPPVTLTIGAESATSTTPSTIPSISRATTTTEFIIRGGTVTPSTPVQ